MCPLFLRCGGLLAHAHNCCTSLSSSSRGVACLWPWGFAFSMGCNAAGSLSSPAFPAFVPGREEVQEDGESGGAWWHKRYGHMRLTISPTCPFRRKVCTGFHTCLLRVHFDGWSAQPIIHLSYLSFSADGLHGPLCVSPTCPFRWMVRIGVYTSLLLVLFGGRSTKANTHVSYLSFSADGLHMRLHISPTCPFRRMVCTGHYTCLLLVHFGESC